MAHVARPIISEVIIHSAMRPRMVHLMRMTVRILSLPFTESEIMEIVVRKSPKVYAVRVGEHRLSSYRGVIILWDGDTDTRVLNAIDAMPALVQVL